jgi:hypothetical protein
MAAESTMPSTDYSALAIANRALEKANEIGLKQVRLEADLNSHLQWCMKAREAHGGSICSDADPTGLSDAEIEARIAKLRRTAAARGTSAP